MKTVKRILAVAMAILSFFTTVLCMRDVLAVRDDLQAEENTNGAA